MNTFIRQKKEKDRQKETRSLHNI